MRWLFGIMLTACLCGSSFAQQNKSLIAPPGNPHGYWLTKDDKSVARISEYEKIGKFYHVTGISGKTTQLFESSVKKLVAITDAEVEAEAREKSERIAARDAEIAAKAATTAKAAADAKAERDAESARLYREKIDRDNANRIASDDSSPAESTSGSNAGSASSLSAFRSSGRTSAPSSGRTSARTSSPSYSSGSAGTTATGLPLHVGPRGGVYHYSASGKKVYQRKK